MKPKHLPRLWCAVQGLLPFDACVAAQRAELALPPLEETESVHFLSVQEYCVADRPVPANGGGLEPI